MRNTNLDKAQQLYSAAYDPRMFCSDYYHEKSMDKGIREATDIVMAELDLSEKEASKLLYLAYSASEYIGFMYQKQIEQAAAV